jgi:hypothetical protein
MPVNAKVRLSVPGPGRTIALAAEERARYVRKAVHLIEPALRSRGAEAALQRLFAPRWDGGATSPVAEPTSGRAAWALVNVWLLARLTGAVDSRATFADAEDWFVGGHRPELLSLAGHVPAESAAPALRALFSLSYCDGLLELLPYLLELHGPGSRLSVMRDPGTRVARDAKRRSGVYYTPADVAEYMVHEVLSGRELGQLRCLDPSCGTGVYLVALLRAAASQEANGKPFDRLAYATSRLYGFDISTLAVESCTFVLTHHCLTGVKVSPWAAWHAIRLNLAATDALRLQPVWPGEAAYADAARTREGICQRLLAGHCVTPVEEKLPAEGRRGTPFSLFPAEDDFPALGSVIPEAQAGFEVLVGNPPYAALGRRRDAHVLEREYASLRPGRLSKADLYPLFIEMMWRLTRPCGNSSAVVVPLSVSYHQGPQFRACRRAMASHGGRWRCAFFDREPHALFGEDVKTRNAILIRRELPGDPARGKEAEVETGPLRKWTSRTREALFSSITFSPLRRVTIADGIPKLDGGEQGRALSLLTTRTDSLRTLCERCRTCQPKEATLTADYPRVFVASTAYNFLNVFRSITADKDCKYPLSENTVHCLEFTTEGAADLAFAVLSSRLTYWLWHVRGDGFHVGAWFIQGVPFGKDSFTPAQAEVLRQAGRALWAALQAHRIVSVNKGKQTIAYRPLTCEKERDVIDDVLIDAARIPKRFRQALKAFVQAAVVVDDADGRRQHLKSLFDAKEGDHEGG